MSYSKTTIISGYDVAEKNPFSRAALGRAAQGAEMDQCVAWQKEHRRSAALNGHWSPEAASRYAERRGWFNAEMRHSTSDLSGKGRGSEDGVWRLLPGGKAEQIEAARDYDDSAEIHDLADSLGN